MAAERLGNTPLQAPEIELAFRCFGDGQWSEHFSFSRSKLWYRLFNVRLSRRFLSGSVLLPMLVAGLHLFSPIAIL
jgi:hypothetical protein